jgi:hypothetical protein
MILLFLNFVYVLNKTLEAGAASCNGSGYTDLKK